eukprot:TRINITY_DN17_c0_g3_i1.p1 TRINITY_DN17_c0_g3~~TRINITY_DN17_c0_g3_i1.p1  ORF type:complete len:891 (+),score=239.83 TRINITY_DN17_c0_g3_i1:205-2673(+)
MPCANPEKEEAEKAKEKEEKEKVAEKEKENEKEKEERVKEKSDKETGKRKSAEVTDEKSGWTPTNERRSGSRSGNAPLQHRNSLTQQGSSPLHTSAPAPGSPAPLSLSATAAAAAAGNINQAAASAAPPRVPLQRVEGTENWKEIIRVSETIFASLPVRAASFQSGRFRIRGPAETVSFSHPFRTKPRFSAWIMLNNAPGIYRVSQDTMSVTETTFSVTLSEATTATYMGYPVNWMAYEMPVTNPLLGDIVKLVLAHPPQLSPVLLVKLEKVLQACAVIDSAADGQTLLHAASYSGNSDLITWLLNKGANLDAQDERGWTPLMCAVNACHFGAAFLLVSRGANPFLVNNRGHSALHLLVRCRMQNKDSIDVLKQLLCPGADTNGKCSTGETPLMYACSVAFHQEVIGMLLEANADPNISENHGMYPLCKAMSSNNVVLIDMLLRYGADPRLGPEGATPMEQAQNAGNVALVAKFEQACTSNHTRKGAGEQTPKRLAGLLKQNYATLGVTPQKVKAAKAVSRNPTQADKRDFEATLNEAREIRSAVDSFVRNFPRYHYTLEEEGPVLVDFLDELITKMKENPTWSTLQPAQFEIAQYQMRHYVFKRMYSVLFNKKELTEQDTALNEKATAISAAITPAHLDVDLTQLDGDLLISAEKELQEIDSSILPEEKLTCLMNATKIIFCGLKDSGAAGTADDFVPLLLWTVLRANLPRLHSNLSYIERFAVDLQHSESSYFFTTLAFVAASIETMNLEEVLQSKPAEPTASVPVPTGAQRKEGGDSDGGSIGSSAGSSAGSSTPHSTPSYLVKPPTPAPMPCDTPPKF